MNFTLFSVYTLLDIFILWNDYSSSHIERYFCTRWATALRKVSYKAIRWLNTTLLEKARHISLPWATEQLFWKLFYFLYWIWGTINYNHFDNHFTSMCCFLYNFNVYTHGNKEQYFQLICNLFFKARILFGQ